MPATARYHAAMDRPWTANGPDARDTPWTDSGQIPTTKGTQVEALNITIDAEQGMGINPALLIAQGTLTNIAPMRHGTHEGRAVVCMIVTLENGEQVWAQTTWRLFHTAHNALAASPIILEETA